MLGDDLNLAISHCRNLGLKTRCVTNGYWAKSFKGGRQRLAGLKDSGLNELNISTGDYHQKFVPVEAVVNAALLGVELGMDQTLIVVEVHKGREATAESLWERPEISPLRALGDARFKIIESPWISTSLDVTVPQSEPYLINRTNVHLRQPCGSMLRTLVLTPSSKVGLCCGLTREQIPEMNSPWDGTNLETVLEDAGRDFMKIWIAVDGPERIMAWAASKDPKIEWEDKYSHHCHACLALYADERIRKTLREHYRERVDDVLMRYSILLRSSHGEAINSTGSTAMTPNEFVTAETERSCSSNFVQLQA